MSQNSLGRVRCQCSLNVKAPSTVSFLCERFVALGAVSKKSRRNTTHDFDFILSKLLMLMIQQTGRMLSVFNGS